MTNDQDESYMPTAATIRHTLAAAFAFLLFTAPAFAADKVKITGVSVGLPTGDRPVDRDDAGVAKFAAWAPVYVSLEILGEVAEPAELVIEAPDTDELTTTLAIPLNLTGVAPGTKVFVPERGAMGYVRPAGSSSEITVTIRTTTGTPISAPHRVRLRPRESLQYVVLALGGAPSGFELPKPALGGADVGTLRAGRIELAHINTYADLPDEWFGYEAADLVIVNTGTATPEFLAGGTADTPTAKRKQEALLEWVRRGGRIVISVGANAKTATQLPYLKTLLPYTIKPEAPTRMTDAFALYWSAGYSNQANVMRGGLGTKGGPPFPMANLVPVPGKAARVVIPPSARQSEEREPVAAQSAFGLGRVTVIGFDLDTAPFSEFSQRKEFWDWVLREGGAHRASAGGDIKPRPPGSLTEEEDEAAVAIRHHNDTFDGVAVVSFGWIAMLIALYILLIGPIEYYFLKRILGRLELTWITFPIIVLSVSALAYISADVAKGRELKVNKIDVVDVDPVSNRIYGTTWFTLFSPKIDTYSIGVTPANDWGTSFGSGQEDATEVNWVGAPRGGRPGIVQRKYTIHSDRARSADGLENVPIQIWSTKAFSANWSASIVPDSHRPPRLVESNLLHPSGDPTKVIGTFRHNLSVPALTDCIAFYAGQAYLLPGEVIVRGEAVRLVLDQSVPAVQWLQTKGQLETLLNRVQSYAERPGQKLSQKQQPQVFTGPLPMWGVLFHEGTLKNEEGTYARNASLRRLDQSWRLSPDNLDEVIIVGRVAPQYGPAEEILTGPNAPSKLWLKGLPGSGDRQPISGTARQETWVRMYLPVR